MTNAINYCCLKKSCVCIETNKRVSPFKNLEKKNCNRIGLGSPFKEIFIQQETVIGKSDGCNEVAIGRGDGRAIASIFRLCKNYHQYLHASIAKHAFKRLGCKIEGVS